MRWDETPIESGFPASAVNNTTNKTKQASHRITTTTTTTEYTILLATSPLTRFIQAASRPSPAPATSGADHFPFFDFRPLNVWDVKKPSNPWFKRIVHTSLLVSTTFRRVLEQTRAPLLFGLETSFSSFSFLRSSTSQVFCPRSLRGLGSPVLTYAPLWLQERILRYPQSCFASDLSITQKPRVSSDPLHKDRHTYPQSSLSSCRTSKRMGTFPFFPHDSAIIIAEPLLIPNFQPEIRGVLFWKLISTQLEFTRRSFLLFPAGIFASHLTILSAPGYQSRTGHSLAFVQVSMQGPCGAFISVTETYSVTKDSVLSICGLSPGLWRLLIFIFVLRPEPPCPGRLVPPSLFHLTQCLIEVLVHVWVLRVSALHQLPEFCHYELWMSSLTVESSDVFPQNTVQLPFHLVAFILDFVEVVLHFFDQVSCFVLFFPSLSEPPIEGLWSFLFLFLVVFRPWPQPQTICAIRFLFSHFLHSFCSTASFSAEIYFHFLLTERCPTYRENSDHRYPLSAVSITTLVFLTILCPAISLASRSWQVLRLPLSFSLSTIFPFQREGHEEARDTRCMVSESKEAVASDGSSHSSLH